MSLLELPVGILETIVDNVNKVNRSSLIPLSLTSRVFVEPCQRYLFSVIRLDIYPATAFPDGHPKHRWMLSVFNDNPNIARYTHTLYIRQGSASQDAWTSTTASHGRSLADIVRHLAGYRVRSLALHATSYTIAWPLIDPTLQQCLFDLLHAPTLISFTAIRWIVPRTLFSCIPPQLQNVTLAYITQIDWDFPNVEPHQEVHRLKTFTLQHFDAPSSTHVPPNLDFDGAHSLSLSALNFSQHELNLLRSPNLTSLTLGTCYIPSLHPSAWAAAFAPLTSLISLTIRLTHIQFSSGAFLWIEPVLSSLPQSGALLQSLVLNFCIFTERSLTGVLPQLGSFANALTQAYRNLKSLETFVLKFGVVDGDLPNRRITLKKAVIEAMNLTDSENEETSEGGKPKLPLEVEIHPFIDAFSLEIV